MTKMYRLTGIVICLLSILTTVEMYRDYSSPFNDPCGASATQAHDGDIAFNRYLPTSEGGVSREKRGATALRARLWPNGRIPYKISPAFRTYERNQIYEAMRVWENRTCVRFYERPESHNESYVYFFRGGCCASYVGRQTVDLQQGISLGASCNKFSTYLHEIGHAVGFWHEQSRPDRDEYIQILTNNVLHGAISNFQIQKQINSLGIGYDYNSIMHYSSTAFGGGRTTIVADDPSIPVGGAVDLSDLDVLQTNLLYQCDMENPPPLEVPPPPQAFVSDAPLPDLPSCGGDYTAYEGFITSPGYPTPYPPNMNCAWRIHLPEGTKLEITVADLHMEWSSGCPKDSLAVYKTMDGSGHAQWSPRCGAGENMTITMDKSIAYIKFISDATNRWEGMRGFAAVYKAKDVNECLVENGGCSQNCTNEQPGYRCSCREGWFLSGDMKTCFDMNECAVGNGGCQYKCRNTGGSFHCKCPEGSTLNADGRTCSNPSATCATNNGGCDHSCSDGSQGVTCSCRAGYRLQPDGVTCRDIDECLEHNTCSYGGCRNTDGSYTCTCESGYEMDSTTSRCINVDECALSLHLCHGEAECLDTDGAYECTCRKGLTLSSNKLTCVDVNECQLNSSLCSHTCMNTHGSYECHCNAGYNQSTSGHCIDIDECLERGCSHIVGSTCHNTPGSFECLCSPGFRLSGSTCTDINECAERTHSCESGCVNTNGSYTCTCQEGYIQASDGSCKCGGVFNGESGHFSTPGWPHSYPRADFECEWIVNLPNPEATIQFAIDETAYGINGRSPCPTDYVQFFDGADDDSQSMYKLCKFDRPSAPIVTTTSDGRVIFKGSRRFRSRSRVGVRVEYTTIAPPTPRSCNVENGGCGQVCSESNLRVSCNCMQGYSLGPDGMTCRDINECAEKTHTCDSGCVNTDGSYTCTCQEGYSLSSDGRSCEDINECLNGACSEVAGSTCHNTAGSFECQCSPGFRVSGSSCKDIDECAEGTHNCPSGCANTKGSFTCTCQEGYIRASDGSCKCGGVFNGESGHFSTPGWPRNYPMADFECEWIVNLPNPEATIQFSIDETAYGINGRSPCPTDYVQFFDGADDDSQSMYKLCKFDRPSAPIVTTTSDGRVIFKGSRNTNRPASRVGVKINYSTVVSS